MPKAHDTLTTIINQNELNFWEATSPQLTRKIRANNDIKLTQELRISQGINLPLFITQQFQTLCNSHQHNTYAYPTNFEISFTAMVYCTDKSETKQ